MSLLNWMLPNLLVPVVWECRPGLDEPAETYSPSITASNSRNLTGMWLNVGGLYHLDCFWVSTKPIPTSSPETAAIGRAPLCFCGYRPNQRRGICPPPGRTSCSGTATACQDCVCVYVSVCLCVSVSLSMPTPLKAVSGFMYMWEFPYMFVHTVDSLNHRPSLYSCPLWPCSCVRQCEVALVEQ